ncbi:MAG: RNA polymerase sigma factor [Coprobacillus sp.]|nr:RNA polymerase sigma factor [Coprobacillus sp.]MDY4145001.1 RNA polymerase sigma factor [Bacilli bacterium]CCY06921.1 rNA polymerase sigma-70 factor ECF subfamily [Coprobacillus sp. CAG:698]
MNKIDTEQMNNIIRQLKSGNMDLFDDFYELTKKQVYVAIINIIKNKTICEDIMQDTYLKFLNNIHKYKDKTNVIAFIVTIARNLAINEYNKNKREVHYDLSLYEEEIVSKTEETPLLDLVYETLSGIELEVFILHVIDDLKHREIAKIMKKPLGTITWIYNKALKKMKEKVGENNE